MKKILNENILLHHDAISSIRFCDQILITFLLQWSLLTCHLSLFAARSFDTSDVLALAVPYGLLRHLEKSIAINKLWLTILQIWSYTIGIQSIRIWHSFTRRRTVLLAQATAGVDPFETSSQNVADIAEIEKEKRHPYYRVHYSRDFAPFLFGTNVAVTCAVNENAASEFYRRASLLRLVSVTCLIRPVN